MSPLATELFDYDLPADRIAQVPAGRRDGSRLLVVDRTSRTVEHTTFGSIGTYLRPGDTLIRNNAAVLPARLSGRKPSGGEVECLLLRPLISAAEPSQHANGRRPPGGTRPPPTEPPDRLEGGPPFASVGAPATEDWACLVRPGRRLQVGATFSGGVPSSDGAPFPGAGDKVANGGRGDSGGQESGCPFSAEIISRDDSAVAIVRFTLPRGGTVQDLANRTGRIPLPPYIGRDGTEDDRPDRERYQTVYADRSRQVAVAAPTAGLHFTPELLDGLRSRGIRTADVTLHVGMGTFKPISTPTIDGHKIHRETYEIPDDTQRLLFGGGGGRRIAVGTTSVRSVEDFLAKHPAPLGRAHIDEAALFIRPPALFRGVDALITNFHQPRSTLLCLVAAFLSPGSTNGIAWLRELYGDALARGYRFLSYGDAMLIL